MIPRVNKDPTRMTLASSITPRYGVQIPGDRSHRESYRPTQTRPGQLFMSDLKDSGLYPNALTVKAESDRLKVSIAMCHYAPEDIKLEVVDGFVVIEAEHAERKEKRSFVTRHFRRRFALPMTTDMEGLRAKMSVYGWLTIVVPLLATGEPEFWSPDGGSRAQEHPEPTASNKQPEAKRGRPIPIDIVE